MLSTLVIAFLPRSKCLLISWLQSPSAVIVEPKKIKALTVPMVSPGISWDKVSREETLTWVWGVGSPQDISMCRQLWAGELLLASSSACRSYLLLPTLLPSPKRDRRRESDTLSPPCCLAKMRHRRGAKMALLFWTQLKPSCWERLKMKGEGGSRGPMVR